MISYNKQHYVTSGEILNALYLITVTNNLHFGKIEANCDQVN